MRSFNVVFCIENYNEDAGATAAVHDLIKTNRQFDKVAVLANSIARVGAHDFEIRIANDQTLDELFLCGNFHYIHYYHANGDNILKTIVSYFNQHRINLPIITTVCQRPSFPGLWLNPFEIGHSNLLIFLDKTASKDKMYEFLPAENKIVLYTGCSDNLIETTKRINETSDYMVGSRPTVYGRGSYLQKCPKTMFEVFDSINGPKRFIIVGGGTPKHKAWIASESQKRDYPIDYLGSLPFDNWLSILKTFDVFLYHLPNDAWSSVDGTLMQAMLLKKPVVYCGPNAPKEILIHMQNGLVAKTEKEIPELCELLQKDKELFNKLAKNARETVVEKFCMSHSCEQYNFIVDNLLASDTTNKIKVPFLFRITYIKEVVFFRLNNLFKRIISMIQ